MLRVAGLYELGGRIMQTRRLLLFSMARLLDIGFTGLHISRDAPFYLLDSPHINYVGVHG